MAKKVKKKAGVAFYGKVRIATIGHRKAINHAKDIASKTGGKLTIGLSGTSEPLTPALKKKHAETVFDHPVMTGNEHTRTLSHFLTHMSNQHDDFHLVAGSDRAPEYRSFLERYNGKKDRNGNTPINFRSWKVHEVPGERVESNKDPRKMSKDDLERSVSASKLESLAKEGKWDHFKAYHPGMPEAHVRKLYSTIRAFHKLTESLKLQISEEITRKQLAPMLDSFVSFASDKLGLKSMPNIRYKSDEDEYNSFAAYSPGSKELSISTANRHPMDIFRSVAHELVHHKQNEDGRLGKDIAREGETGSDIENEANFEAGKIMRWFAKEQPHMFGKSYVVETNTAAIGGAIRGLGNVTGEVSPTEVSQYVLDNQAYTENLKSGNRTDGLWNSKSDPNDDFNWYDEKEAKMHKVNGQKTFKAMRAQLNEGINDPGKLKAVFLAGGPGSGKDFVMNKTLVGNGLREINSDVAFEFLMNRHGLDMEMPDEERVEREIVRGRAKNITSKKEISSLAGRLGLIVNGTADDLEKIKTVKSELEDLGYDTMMVFVNTSNEVSRQRNVERGKSGNRKVPDGTDKQGVPDNSPNIRQEKWDLAQKNIGALMNIFGKDNFTVIDNTADIRKVSPEQKEKIEADFNRVRRMAMQFAQSPVNNKRGNAWAERSARYKGVTQYTPPKSISQIRQQKPIETPNAIIKPSNDIMDQARRLGLSYYGFGRFGRKVNGSNKVLFHSVGGKLVRATMTEEKKMGNPCWSGFKAYGMKKKNGKEVPNCVPVEEGREAMDMQKEYKKHNRLKGKITRKLAENIDNRFETFVEEHGAGDWGTSKLTKRYKKDTPGQNKKLAKEDNLLPVGGLPVGDGVGPTITQYRPMTAVGFALAESIVNWMNNPKTQQKFAEKYGDLAEQKLMEAAIKLEQSGCGSDMPKDKKSVKKIKEGLGLGYNDMSPIGVQRKQEIEEKSETWQTKEGQNPNGGLNAKGRAQYNREHGAHLKRPQPEGGNRRDSYCARSAGQLKMWPKAAKDPNSRLRKARRAWNCEE
jgi:hypothetical protein